MQYYTLCFKCDRLRYIHCDICFIDDLIERRRTKWRDLFYRTTSRSAVNCSHETLFAESMIRRGNTAAQLSLRIVAPRFNIERHALRECRSLGGQTSVDILRFLLNRFIVVWSFFVLQLDDVSIPVYRHCRLDQPTPTLAIVHFGQPDHGLEQLARQY